MTTKHEHPDYTSKTSFKIYTTIILSIIGTICMIMIVCLSQVNAATSKAYEVEVKVEKHQTDFEYVKETLADIKLALKEQKKMSEANTKLLVEQGHALDDIAQKLDNHLSDCAVLLPYNTSSTTGGE